MSSRRQRSRSPPPASSRKPTAKSRAANEKKRAERPARSDRSRSPVRRTSGKAKAKSSGSSSSSSNMLPPNDFDDLTHFDLNTNTSAGLRPNFKPSGLLNRAALTGNKTNKPQKYFEPVEGCKPDKSAKYRFYVFDKNNPERITDVINLDQQSYYLIGRDKDLAHILLDFDTKASAQHAVVQFRRKVHKIQYGETVETIRPYLIDLESTNGTKLNGLPIETSRYVELRPKDIIHFAASPEFVFIAEE